MYDPINAFYEIIYHVVIICTGNVFWKSQEINENNGVYRTSNFLKILKKNHHLLKNIVLTLMLWKRSNLTQRIARVSVRQGPSRRPSLADWRRDCSPEGTHVIPREQYVSLLCPQISEIEKLGNSYSYRILVLFVQDPSYLVPLTVQRICSYRIWNIRTGSSFIYTGSEIFIPDPKYSYRILFYSYQIRIYWIVAGYSREFKYHREQTTCLKIICTGSENTWVKPSNWLIS